MKKSAVIIALLLIMLLSAGCGILYDVDDMLVNPALSVQEKEIMKAVNSLSDDEVVLKYPLSGDSRLPIMFFDLDGDSAEEAVAFYSIPSESVFSGLAVLEQEKESWLLAGCIEGSGPEISSVRVLSGGNGECFILVCWSSGNRDQKLASYHYGSGGLIPGIEDNCSEVITRDFDGDGVEEICYISSDDENFYIKFIEGLSLDEPVYSQCRLSNRTMAVSQLSSGQLYDGCSALFVDEATLDEKKQTEIFTLHPEEGISALVMGDRVSGLTQRPYRSPSCHIIPASQFMSVPAASVPFDGIIDPECWTYWYGFSSDNIEFSGLSLSSADYRFDIFVPDEWALLYHSEQDPEDAAQFNIVTNEGEKLFSLKVLYVGDSSDPDFDGYRLLQQSVNFKYYYSSSCDFSDLGFILRNFVCY